MKAFWKLVNLLKISCKNDLNCCLIMLKWPPIYRGQKQLQRFVGIKSQKKNCQKIELLESVRSSDSSRSTGPVDRQRSKIRPLGISGRPPGRPNLPESTAQCSVDRGGRLTRTCTELCASIDRDGRPVSVISEISELPETRNWGFWNWSWIWSFVSCKT